MPPGIHQARRSRAHMHTCSASESCRILLLLCASDFEHVHVGTMHAQLWTFPFLRPVLRAGLPTPAPNSPSDITPTRHHWSGSGTFVTLPKPAPRDITCCNERKLPEKKAPAERYQNEVQSQLRRLGLHINCTVVRAAVRRAPRAMRGKGALCGKQNV
jgi:hypothetical protein